MGAIRKLKRQLSGPKYEVGPLRPNIPFPGRKMSEVLLEFARPMLDFVDDDELFEDVISFAIVCWNLSFFPEHEQLTEWKTLTRNVGRAHLFSDPEIENWVLILLERKKTLFANDRRIVVDHSIVEEPDQHHLYVVSALAKD